MASEICIGCVVWDEVWVVVRVVVVVVVTVVIVIRVWVGEVYILGRMNDFLLSFLCVDDVVQ